MSTWNDVARLDVPEADLDITRSDVREMDLPTFDPPGAVLPPIVRMIGLVGAAAYAGFGATVVTTMQLHEHRRQLTDQVTARIRALVDVVT